MWAKAIFGGREKKNVASQEKTLGVQASELLMEARWRMTEGANSFFESPRCSPCSSRGIQAPAALAALSW